MINYNSYDGELSRTQAFTRFRSDTSIKNSILSTISSIVKSSSEETKREIQLADAEIYPTDLYAYGKAIAEIGSNAANSESIAEACQLGQLATLPNPKASIGSQSIRQIKPN